MTTGGVTGTADARVPSVTSMLSTIESPWIEHPVGSASCAVATWRASDMNARAPSAKTCSGVREGEEGGHSRASGGKCPRQLVAHDERHWSVLSGTPLTVDFWGPGADPSGHLTPSTRSDLAALRRGYSPPPTHRHRGSHKTTATRRRVEDAGVSRRGLLALPAPK